MPLDREALRARLTEFVKVEVSAEEDERVVLRHGRQAIACGSTRRHRHAQTRARMVNILAHIVEDVLNDRNLWDGGRKELDPAHTGDPVGADRTRDPVR